MTPLCVTLLTEATGGKPSDARLLVARAQVRVRRVGDLLHTQPVCRHHDDRRMTSSGYENRCGPLDRPASLPDRDHRPHQCADHGSTECVGHDPRLEHTVSCPRPGELEQSANGRPAVSPLGERGKVPQPQELLGCGTHGPGVQRPSMDQRVVAAQGIKELWLVADAVEVATLDGRETGVEALWCHRDAVYDDVVG